MSFHISFGILNICIILRVYINAVLYLSAHNWTEFLVDFKMGESLDLDKKSSGPETDTETWSWFRLPIPKQGFGRTLRAGLMEIVEKWSTLFFCEFSCTQCHDNCRKMECLIHSIDPWTKLYQSFLKNQLQVENRLQT